MASESLLEDILRCRYEVCKSITPSGFGWDTPRLNEVIAAHTANLARPVDEDDFYGIEDAIAKRLSRAAMRASIDVNACQPHPSASHTHG